MVNKKLKHLPSIETQIVFVDTESGGTDPVENPVLTLGACLFDVMKGEILETYDVRIKHDDYSNVTPEALGVNGIDLEAHHNHPLAEYPHQAKQSFMDWLGGFRKRKELSVLGGHNLGFDEGFMVLGLTDEKGFGFPLYNFFHYRKVDTQMLATIMRHAGLLPIKKTSLEAVTKFFGIEVENYHTALDDAVATAKAYYAMLSVLKELRQTIIAFDEETSYPGSGSHFSLEIFGVHLSF